MSFAYMPFYTGDYYRDTRHLSMLQHGAYRLLIDHCWDQRGPLPLDMTKCYRVCGAVSKEEQDAVQQVIAEFFTRMDDGYYQKRIHEEIERANVLSGKRSGAAHARWDARQTIGKIAAAQHANAMQMHSKSNAIAPSPSPSPSPSPTLTPEKKERESAPSAPRATRLPADWSPGEAGTEFAAGKLMSDERIAEEADKFRDYWLAQPDGRAKKADWSATWRTWIRRAVSDVSKGPARAPPEPEWRREQKQRMQQFAGRYAAQPETIDGTTRILGE